MIAFSRLAKETAEKLALMMENTVSTPSKASVASVYLLRIRPVRALGPMRLGPCNMYTKLPFAKITHACDKKTKCGV